MIKKFIAAFVAPNLLLMAGCAPGTLGAAGLTPAQIQLVDQAQAGAIGVCGVMPVVESIAAILFGPVGMGVDAAVSAFCSALPTTPLSAARGASSVGQVVSGVLPNGTVVKGIRTK